MRYEGIECRYYQINNRIFKQGKNVSNLCYSLFPFTFIFLRQMHHSAQSLFHRNLDRIPTHFGDNQRLGNGIRGSTVQRNRRIEILSVNSKELNNLAIIRTRNTNAATYFSRLIINIVWLLVSYL